MLFLLVCNEQTDSSQVTMQWIWLVPDIAPAIARAAVVASPACLIICKVGSELALVNKYSYPRPFELKYSLLTVTGSVI